jgi:hypothetical protein
MTGVRFDADRWFFELPELREDAEIRARALACIEAERGLVRDLAGLGYAPCPTAKDRVAPEALERLLAAGTEVHGVASEREVTNAITFNARHVADAVHDRRVAHLRAALDRSVARRLHTVFEPPRRLLVFNSGHFWYPPGSFMGWHTNSLHPAWRLYVTHAEEPGKSFIRYRDPRSGEIVTSLDQSWDFRLFRISRDTLLWHAVYSETNRFSFGFMIRPWTLAGRAGSLWRRARVRLLRS